MKGTNIGEFEELVLLVVGAMGRNAYGAAIKNEIISLTDRLPSTGALHTALHRLINKGLIITDERQKAKDRGRPKIYFSLSHLGKTTLVKARNLRNELFERIPNLIN